MLCSDPFYKSTNGDVTKKKTLLVSNSARDSLTPFGCGQCLPCRINQSRIMTGRILLENLNAKTSAFIGITYAEEYLQHTGPVLNKSDLQKYIKRIRRVHEPTKLRFFACGEYGGPPQKLSNGKISQGYRPHYHIALFSNSVLNPEDIRAKWEYGNTTIGDISRYSARYIAGYCVKKLTARNDPKLHALNAMSPEFTTASRQEGGIGLPGIKKIAKQIKKDKFIDKKKILKKLTIGGKIYPLGRYLISKLMDELGQDHRQLGIEFWDYQQELFNKHKDQLDKDSGYYLKAIRDEYAQERLVQEKRHKIYQQRKQRI